MFRTITRLLFAGEEEAAEDVKSGEVVDDGWLVVAHQGRKQWIRQLEASSSEHQDALFVEAQQSNSPPPRNTPAKTGSDSSLNSEPAVLRSSTTASRALLGSVLQPKPLTDPTQLACVQKAKAWAGRHHASRNAIQRQNQVLRGDQHHSFHLQQPGHRSFSH